MRSIVPTHGGASYGVHSMFVDANIAKELICKKLAEVMQDAWSRPWDDGPMDVLEAVLVEYDMPKELAMVLYAALIDQDVLAEWVEEQLRG